MKAKELIKQLQETVEKHGDMDVVFDTEARCFDTHLVDVCSLSYVPKELAGPEDMICLGFDFNKEPHHSNKGENNV